MDLQVQHVHPAKLDRTSTALFVPLAQESPHFARNVLRVPPASSAHRDILAPPAQLALLVTTLTEQSAVLALASAVAANLALLTQPALSAQLAMLEQLAPSAISDTTSAQEYVILVQ